MTSEGEATALVAPLTGPRLTADQVDLITRTVARGASKDELALFLHACKRTGLDPLMRQIHAVKRWDRDSNRETLTIQTGIDGLRLVAERTGKYAPGREPAYVYTDAHELVSATAYVKKLTADGTWHEVAATAHWKEYVQKRKDGNVTAFWSRMPHVMLAKCAEALALRRAFPMELSGIYAHEEMTQASPGELAETATPTEDAPKPATPRRRAAEPAPDAPPESLEVEESEPTRPPPPPATKGKHASQVEREVIRATAKRCGVKDEDLTQHLANTYAIEGLIELPSAKVNNVLDWLRAQRAS